MKTTSHFIGIKINSKAFIDLFFTLQKYIKDNDLALVIELQDIQNLHVSLYYLPQEIPAQELSSIKNTIKTLHDLYKDFMLTHNKVSYFKKDDSDYLCYVVCSQTKELNKLNRQLANQYKKIQIPDNQYDYIPHISLFRVLNNKLFFKHKENITTTILQALKNIQNENLFQGIFFFGVNSNFHPEMQCIVDSF